MDAGKGLNALQAMLWKYVARCALPAGQELEAPDASTGRHLKFPGLFGAAPEWRDGKCDLTCQQKVSSCLIALTNRTGKHVLLSILSGDPAMGKQFRPDEHDLEFPHQEGAFFGNVFSNQAYACQGRDVEKGPQVKRFCALDPGSCSGLAQFVDVGRCADACQLTCSRLSDGSERCAAVSCRDPSGAVWTHPMTTYLRNRIEAANADAAVGIRVTDSGLDQLDAGDSVTFKQVDFGRGDRAAHTFAVDLVSPRAQGNIQVWVDDARLIGVLKVQANPRAGHEQTAPLQSPTPAGPHDVTLKVLDGKNIGHLNTIEFR